MQPEVPELLPKWRDLRRQFRRDGDDTAQRLAYALEWERTHTSPVSRALLIRLQIRLAQIDRNHPQWFRLKTQAEEILLDGRDRLIPRRLFQDMGITNEVFFRGFIEGCTVPARTLLSTQDRATLFDFAPLRHLSITGIDPNDPLDWLFQQTEFRTITSLAMDCQGLTNEALSALKDSQLQNLRSLSIRHNHLTEDCLNWLQYLPKLAHVDFSGHGEASEPDIHEDQGILCSRRPPALAQKYAFLRDPLPDPYHL
jgi:hypothetical protein